MAPSGRSSKASQIACLSLRSAEAATSATEPLRSAESAGLLRSTHVNVEIHNCITPWFLSVVSSVYGRWGCHGGLSCYKDVNFVNRVFGLIDILLPKGQVSAGRYQMPNYCPEKLMLSDWSVPSSM